MALVHQHRVAGIFHMTYVMEFEGVSVTTVILTTGA